MTPHEVRHAPVAVSHLYGAQGTAVSSLHAPVPLQVCIRVFACPMHMGGPQLVPAGCQVQPPLPSHRPSVPQVDGAWVGQTSRGSSPPAGTFRQVPAAPAWLHEKQTVLQRLAQQTPSTQIVLEH